MIKFKKMIRELINFKKLLKQIDLIVSKNKEDRKVLRT